MKQLLWPLNIDEFMREYWKKRVFSTKLESGARFNKLIKNLLFDLNLTELMENTSSDSIHVWMKELSSNENDSNKPSTKQLSSFTMEDPSTVMTIWNSVEKAISLYFRAPPEASHLLVESATKELGLNFGGYFPDENLKGEIETFVSKKDNVTDWHFDFQENFTFQLKGR